MYETDRVSSPQTYISRLKQDLPDFHTEMSQAKLHCDLW